MAWWASRPEDLPPPAAPPDARAHAQVRSPVATATSEPEATPPAEVPDTPEEHALAAVAKALGAGTIRCVLPMEPEGLVSPFPHTVWEGRTLVALVEEPAGVQQVVGEEPPQPSIEGLGKEASNEVLTAWMEALGEARRPRWQLTWGGAEADALGWCQVEAPARVTLSGRVVAADGGPLGEFRWLNGCTNGSTPLDDEGRFTLETDAGPPCTLEVGSSGMPGGTVVDRSTDRDDIVVTWQRDQVGMLDALRGKQAEAEAAIEDQRMLYDAALDEVDSDEGRALVQGWKEARLQDRQERATNAAKAVELWERLEASKAP
ncbi:MAG: hypothetical protein H6738_21965 [Alphaproteobacteria bacterium]|nr:hypothetical protein [Alphaproteobacteria bacterium]MCB9699465.1 hypothetical protein [Alphaproteobacteria bacterium]